MPTLISIGQLLTMSTNVVHALPSRQVNLFTNTVIEISNSTTFTTFGTVSSNVPTVVSAAFARCTTGEATLIAKTI